MGSSMIDENKRRRYSLVKQQDVAENGERVVALIDNHEATLKRNFIKSEDISGYKRK